jgi:localization factor PodJL
VRDSQFNIAILHARGLGVPQDLIEAYKWFAIAADHGDTEAAKRRDAIAGTMTTADLAKGKAAASGFEPLPADPVANEVAANNWGPPTTASLRLTPTVDITAHVQQLLAAKGFDPGPADGRPGQKTRDAISGFQKQAGLPVTGEIDPGLVQALEGGST